MNTSVSARKIGASLWEVEPQFNFKNLDDNSGGLTHSLKTEVPLCPDQFHANNSQLVKPYAGDISPVDTSTHLLKVLHRISILEKQHSHDMVLIKSLKRDLDISRAQIKTLVEDRKKDHQEIKELKRSTHERKEKAVQSIKYELLEVKSVFMREKKTRILLESLCDEFASGIRDSEQKVSFLQHKHRGKNQSLSRNKPDRLILRIAELWLDERVHMNRDFAEKITITDDLYCEIESFLETKKKQFRGSGVDILEENRSHGVLVEPSSQLVSRMIDRGPEPFLKSKRKMTDQGPGFAKPSSRLTTRRTVQASGFDEPSTTLARMGVKGTTLMAKLLEARLESQFLKLRRARR